MTKAEIRGIYESVMYQTYLTDLVEDYVLDLDHRDSYYFGIGDDKDYNVAGPGCALTCDPYNGKYFLEVLFDEEDKDDEGIPVVDQAYDDIIENIKDNPLYNQLIVEKGDGGLYFSLDLSKLYQGCVFTDEFGKKLTEQEFLDDILINSETAKTTTISAKTVHPESSINMKLL
jgi:hypothetical protein